MHSEENGFEELGWLIQGIGCLVAPTKQKYFVLQNNHHVMQL